MPWVTSIQPGFTFWHPGQRRLYIQPRPVKLFFMLSAPSHSGGPGGARSASSGRRKTGSAPVQSILDTPPQRVAEACQLGRSLSNLFLHSGSATADEESFFPFLPIITPSFRTHATHFVTWS